MGYGQSYNKESCVTWEPCFSQLSHSLDPAGKYDGTWSSTNGSQSGALHLALVEESGQWKAEASFAFEGDEVPCKVTKLEIEGAKVALAYQFDLGGYKLVSTLTGEIADDSLSGKYETKPVDGGQQIDAGTFKTTRK